MPIDDPQIIQSLQWVAGELNGEFTSAQGEIFAEDERLLKLDGYVEVIMYIKEFYPKWVQLEKSFKKLSGSDSKIMRDQYIEDINKNLMDLKIVELFKKLGINKDYIEIYNAVDITLNSKPAESSIKKAEHFISAIEAHIKEQKKTKLNLESKLSPRAYRVYSPELVDERMKKLSPLEDKLFDVTLDLELCKIGLGIAKAGVLMMNNSKSLIKSEEIRNDHIFYSKVVGGFFGTLLGPAVGFIVGSSGSFIKVWKDHFNQKKPSLGETLVLVPILSVIAAGLGGIYGTLLGLVGGGKLGADWVESRKSPTARSKMLVTDRMNATTVRFKKFMTSYGQDLTEPNPPHKPRPKGNHPK